MQDMIEELKARRRAVETNKALVKFAQEDLQSTEQWQDLQSKRECLAFAENELKEIDTRLREAAIDCFEKTGKKNPVDGVSVVMQKQLKYNLGDAIDWAFDNDAMEMIGINKSKFEKHAKAVEETIPLDFVEIKEVPAVRIAKKI